MNRVVIQRVKDVKISSNAIEINHENVNLKIVDGLACIPTAILVIALKTLDDLIILRLLKLKIFDKWSECAENSKTPIIFLSPNETIKNSLRSLVNKLEIKAEFYYLIENDSKVLYINDGPCTFVM